jgi:hypothetical protein
VNATTGALVRVVSDSSYGFDHILGLSSTGDSLFASDYLANRVIWVNATTCSLVRVLS